MTPDEAIAIVRSKANGRTRYEGQAPFVDEVLVEEIGRLRDDLSAVRSTMRHDEERIRNMQMRMHEMHNDMMRAVYERDEAREAAKHLWKEGIDVCWVDNPLCGGEAVKRWPWIQEGCDE